MTNTTPIQDVFIGRAHGVGHILRDRVWRMVAFASNEPLLVELLPNNPPTLRFRRKSDGDSCIEFGNITPGGLANVVFGEEQILKSEVIGSTIQTVKNRDGVAPITVKFADMFAQTDTSSSTTKTGVSTSLTVKATEKIEGLVGASFEQSITLAANREVTDTHGKSATSSASGEEATTIPKGDSVQITETRARTDVIIPVTAVGLFVHTVAVGKHSGGRWKGKRGVGYAMWDSWQNFCDVIRRDAPDNWDLTGSFKDHPAWHADLWALDPLHAAISYEVTYQGRIDRTYTVRAI